MSAAFAAILALAVPAAAIVAPPGWKLIGLDAHAKDTSVVDAATKTASAEQYMPAEDDPGITLFVTRTTASELRGTRDAAIRALADELRASAARGTDVELTPIAAAGQLALTASWRDGSAHTRRTTRLVIAADASRLVSVIGECIARDDVAAARLDACKAALATLDADVPQADRVALTLPATTAAAPPPAMTAGPTLEPAHLDDGSRTAFPPIVVSPPAPPPPDRRAIYVGAGMVLLALVFWWNRRQRDRFDREEGPTPPRRRRRRDPDADDLHAAARGEAEVKKAEDSDDR